MISAVLFALWGFACWVWSLAPVEISLVLAAMVCGYVAVLLVPRDKRHLRSAVYVRRAVPWADGHDPNEPARVVVLEDEQPIEQGRGDPVVDLELAPVIPLRRTA